MCGTETTRVSRPVKAEQLRHQIVIKSGENAAKVWDVPTGRELITIRGHTRDVDSVAFSPNGQWIVTGSMDKTAKIWDAWTDRKTLTADSYGRNIAFSPDGKQIVTGSTDHTAMVLDAQTGRDTLTLKGHTDIVSGVAYSYDGKWIITGGESGTTKVWDAHNGREILTLKGHTNSVYAVGCSPDGQRIITGDRSMVKIWDVRTGREILTLKGHTNAITKKPTAAHAPFAFSPDGQRIVTWSDDDTMEVWDARTGRELIAVKGHSAWVNSIAFSPDGQQIVSGGGGWSNTAIIWNATTGQELLTLKGHTEEVSSVAYSPDGQRIVTSCSGKFGYGEVKVWEAQTGREVLEMKGKVEGADAYDVRSAVFSPDGRRILTGGSYGVHVWFSDPNDWKDAMRDTNHVNTHLAAAMTLLNDDKNAFAVAEYKAALRLRPTLGTAKFLSNLGLYEYYAGHIDDAIKSSRSALGKDPALTDARMNLGLCYATQNDWPRAQREYDLAVKAAPKANLKSGIYYVQTAIKKQANPALAKALVYLQKAVGK